MYACAQVLCVYVCLSVCMYAFCLPSPSNQSLYRQISGYGISVGDHRVGKGIMENKSVT